MVGVRRGRIKGKSRGGLRLWLYVGVTYTVVGSKGRLSRRTSTASGCLPSPLSPPFPRNEVREGIIYYWNHLIRVSVHPTVRVTGFCPGIFWTAQPVVTKRGTVVPSENIGAVWNLTIERKHWVAVKVSWKGNTTASTISFELIDWFFWLIFFLNWFCYYYYYVVVVVFHVFVFFHDFCCCCCLLSSFIRW